MIIQVAKQILLFFFICWSFDDGCVFGQVKATEILGGEKKIEIPFQYTQGFIIVDVLVNYIFHMKFIVDTGAEQTIIFDRTFADILKIPLEKEIKVYGSDISKDVKAWVIRNIPLQFFSGQKTNHDFIVLNEDLMQLGAITGIKIDGILGGEFLKNFNIELNYKKSVMSLYSQSVQLRRWDKYHKIQMMVHANKPYISTIVDVNGKGSKNILLLVDTGASLSLLVHTESDSLHLLPDHIIKGVIGRGLGGDVIGYSGKIVNLKIGQDSFENEITSFQALDSLYQKEEKILREGILGNSILDNFHLVFNFSKNEILLKKNTRRKRRTHVDKSGLVYYAFGPKLNQYYIHHVVEGSPAYEAGFLQGDIIKKIGIWPIKYYSMESLHKKLSKDDKLLKIEIQRNEKKIIKQLKLRDLYDKKVS